MERKRDGSGLESVIQNRGSILFSCPLPTHHSFLNVFPLHVTVTFSLSLFLFSLFLFFLSLFLLSLSLSLCSRCVYSFRVISPAMDQDSYHWHWGKEWLVRPGEATVIASRKCIKISFWYTVTWVSDTTNVSMKVSMVLSLIHFWTNDTDSYPQETSIHTCVEASMLLKVWQLRKKRKVIISQVTFWYNRNISYLFESFFTKGTFVWFFSRMDTIMLCQLFQWKRKDNGWSMIEW